MQTSESITAFGTRLLLVMAMLLSPVCSWAQASMTTVLTNGPTGKRINIVFLSEGYTASELEQFRRDATNTANALLTVPPFDGYRGYFNAYAIAVASVESGSDHPSTGIARNTYFNSTYESYGTAQLLTIPPNDRDGSYVNGQGKVTALLNQFMPEWDIVVLIVNDTVYGGAGGQYMTVSKNASAPEIARHELGHSFAGLGDEYSTPYPGYPATEEPNTTRETNRNAVKWKAWIDAGTPVPTPVGSTTANSIGLFQGAHYNATGWYRPKNSCKMRTLGTPYCEVCQETLVKSIYSRMGTIQGQAPTSLLANLVAASSRSFQVETPAPQGRALRVRWTFNGTQLTNTTTNLVINAGQLVLGTNTIKVDVTDDTSMVRTDPSGYLHDSQTWRVVLTPGAQLRLLAPTLLADGRMVFNVTGKAPNGFQIQASANFASWTNLLSSGPLDGSITLTNPLLPGNLVGFRTQATQ